ncbi:MAG: hypothetical protein C5B46_03435, partial [Proteobacteria bacterium]
MERQIDMMLDPMRAMLLQVGSFLPRLALALLVVIVGWFLARVIRFAIIKGLRAINFPVLTERAGMDRFLSQGGFTVDTTTIIGVLVYWLVIVAALVIACNGLGLTYITDLLTRIVLFLPRVILALIIVAFGAYFARFVGHTVTTYCVNAHIQDGELLGRIATYAVMAFVIVIALDHLNIGGDIVRDAFLIVLAGIVLAFALA